jgi:hypothetical protein
MYGIFTLDLGHPFNILLLQVMRKKIDTTPATSGVSQKVIVKKPRSSTASARSRQAKTVAVPPQQALPIVSSANVDGGTADEIHSPPDSRDRSTTPIESDLLKYLTAHITPSQVPTETGTCFQSDLTSFVISREEYLHGIIQLVQSDCPEVVQDIDSFMHAMQKAFIDTHKIDTVLDSSKPPF